jgi:hypothetical protein
MPFTFQRDRRPHSDAIRAGYRCVHPVSTDYRLFKPQRRGWNGVNARLYLYKVNYRASADRH